MNEGGRSWTSMMGAVVMLYWGAYFGLRFLAWVRDDKVIWFLLVCFMVGILIRALNRVVTSESGIQENFFRDDEHSTEPLPFFVKGQVRRRKLDLTRSSNFIKDSVSTKQKRQMSGILRKRKKKGGR
jgi:hypothetical protein